MFHAFGFKASQESGDAEFSLKLKAMNDVIDKKIKSFANFLTVPLEDHELLKKDLKKDLEMAVINEFKKEPNAAFAISSDAVKYYQYRLRTVIYERDDCNGKEVIQEYAIHLSFREFKREAVVDIYYFDVHKE